MRSALYGVLGVLVSVCVSIMSGCSDDGAPPYEELLLRDALRAEPRVVSSVPASDRKTLGDRMAREGATEHAVQHVAVDAEPLSVAELIARIDADRAARGEDAWVATLVRTDHGSVEARALSQREGGAVDRTTPLPPLEGEAATSTTRDAETKALEGCAGDLLHDMLEETHATKLVRVTQWPVGAVATGDTVYVNAAWLVAMGALDDSEAQAGGPRRSAASAARGPGVFGVTASESQPRTLRGNPYATFTTLESCAADVTTRCEACLRDGACDESPTLTDFPDARSECDFLGKDQARASQLCALALMSVSTVAECVKKDGCIPPTGSTTSGSLPAADSFLAKSACVRSLNLCLSGSDGNAGPDRALVDVRVEGCQNPFTACSSAIGGCSDACDTGKCNGRSGSSCRSCEGCSKGCTSCSGFSKDSRTGSGTGYGSVGTGKAPGTSSTSSSGSTGASGSSSGTSGSSSGTSGSASSSSGGSSSGGSSSSSGGSSSGGSSSGGSSSSSGGSSSGGSSSGGSSSGGSCNGCGGSSSSSSSGCGKCGGSNCKCEAAPADDRPPFAPFTTLVWMLGPALFLGTRARRSTSDDQSEPNEEGGAA